MVVIQARCNSSRLPGKVLLPINGLPVVVLAAKRAGNKGRKVIVATSSETSDDLLVQTVMQHGIECFRGSLENTLSRFVDALATYRNDTIVFRLTADNVIPDGQLLNEIEQDFLYRGLEYLSCNGMNSGLPYGVSVEITWLKHLRDALASNLSAYDLEHVTPYIIRKFGAQYFEKYLGRQMGHYRCTIDCLDDYLSVAKLFDKVKNSVFENAFCLIERLKGGQSQPIMRAPADRLVLGTAQLGLSYGIANSCGQPSRLLSQKLIKTAIINGVQSLDTARAYGNSEEVIRDALSAGWSGRAKVITKLSPLNDCPQNADERTVNAFVDASLYHSMAALGVVQIDTLLLHRSTHFQSWNGAAWRRLLEHKKKERILTLGVSVQTPEELMISLDNDEIKHIQMPINILDWRWVNAYEKVKQIKSSRSLIIHARSVLLQGLIISKNTNHWLSAHVAKPEPIWKWLDNVQNKCQRDSIIDLCVGFVNGLDWVDGIVIGSENMEQLLENMMLVGNAALSTSQIQEIEESRPKLGDSTLDPVKWIRHS